ncbi:phage shock protein PspC (stress-responsive transcriptional regulator) [Phyllobacterium sp. P30BS-XVII]|uniref:Phage shock protein PspC (Stress-responsive transcriptional regulator) n=1 Tax=Phyllobacterium myrsinacearum TaxID=28101 RepID=A0A839EVY1_9HYPH|nr:phage shock protein PspC (stress-responsive transcriptional regulator) [Phyllobacterium myrsinacearum]MBA8900579.1 phage shock protein PspC (stress-responsive transcriptional regulator) [Phyllobacterium sp. P30BS-XVII]
MTEFFRLLPNRMASPAEAVAGVVGGLVSVFSA